MNRALDFRMIDELGFAAERNRLPHRLPYITADGIGPLIELRQLQASLVTDFPDWGEWLSLGDLSAFGKTLMSRFDRWRGEKNDLIGLLRVQPDHHEARLIAFCHSAQIAAEHVGFPKLLARQFAAFLEEMHSNICEHSDAAHTGLIAYRARRYEFECVIADSGMGVLKSLQGCPNLRDLTDHGEALKLALTEGISRHGLNRGRGLGFRPLFIGLANLNGELRFRSGNAALSMDGNDPIRIPQRISQKPNLRGFFISTKCRPSTQQRVPSPHPDSLATSASETSKLA
jgi:hypothetical protein